MASFFKRLFSSDHLDIFKGHVGSPLLNVRVQVVGRNTAGVQELVSINLNYLTYLKNLKSCSYDIHCKHRERHTCEEIRFHCQSASGRICLVLQSERKGNHEWVNSSHRSIFRLWPKVTSMGLLCVMRMKNVVASFM